MSGLRSITGVALVLTYALIVLGAWVRATNSGLSCPDWPTCYGHWIPLCRRDSGGCRLHVLSGHAGVGPSPDCRCLPRAVDPGDRLLLLAPREQQPRLPLYGVGLVILLLIQASLGGVTVLDQNSPWSVALHLSTALILFSVLWLIFERSGIVARSAAEKSDHDADRVSKSLILMSFSVWLLAIGTMASAAMTAKSGASLACSTWPLCNGAIIPDLGDPLIRLHSAHRWLALVTTFGVILLFLTWRRASSMRGLVHGAFMLILCQIMLGATVIFLEVPVWTAVAHQALGVLTFAYVTRIMCRAGTLGYPPAETAAVPKADTVPASTVQTA